jgi:hypothetical protein
MGSSVLDIFFGSTQSKITAYAIFAAILAICITILLTRTDMTIGNRFLLIFFVILTLVPSIFLILFQITCMVSGGNSKERWWCWAYAWIIAVFIIIYCILIIVISFASLFTYNNAIDKVEIQETQNKMTPDNSNQYAKSIMETSHEVERFTEEVRQHQEQKKQALEKANQEVASGNQGVASGNQGIASANQGVAPANQVVAPANQGVAPANQGIASTPSDNQFTDYNTKQKFSNKLENVEAFALNDNYSLF